MQFKPVMRYDPTQHKFRLFRFGWNKGNVGDGKGYSVKLSLALRPKLFWWFTGWREQELTLLGLSLHRVVSYGGRFA